MVLARFFPSDHVVVRITTINLVRFYKNEFDGLLCKLKSTSIRVPRTAQQLVFHLGAQVVDCPYSTPSSFPGYVPLS